MKTKRRVACGVSALLMVLTVMPLFAGGGTQTPTTGNKDIEAFIAPWNTIPYEGPDPYRDYISKTTGYNWSLKTPTDFASELTTRAAAGTVPDFILFNSSSFLFSMYDQGILLDDWNVYKSAIPNTLKAMGEAQQKYYTRNGKLIAVPTEGGDQLWAWNIHQDWLDKLGLKTPTTPDELFAVAQAFTTRDPDGNGLNDTYAFTSSGGGESLGAIDSLALMFGPSTYYIDNNKVSHPITDGNYKRTLDFIKKVVDAQLIDPNWYSQGWGDMQPAIYNGKIGIVWYPPEALLSEGSSRRNDSVIKDWFSVLPMPKGTANGGKLSAISPFGSIRTVSADVAKDKSKLDAIIQFMESTVLPSKEYWKIRMGYEIDNYAMVEIKGRAYFDWGPDSAKRGSVAGNYPGQNMWPFNWGKLVGTYALQGNPVSGPEPNPDEVTLKALDMSNQVMAHPRYSDESYLLNLSNENVNQAYTVSNEFAIQYILGRTTDYDGFVRRWLAAGGQALLDEATQQFKGYGLIK
jgi:ABC-type glycerol-3-phosphate transport system substrate-binding protein